MVIWLVILIASRSLSLAVLYVRWLNEVHIVYMYAVIRKPELCPLTSLEAKKFGEFYYSFKFTCVWALRVYVCVCSEAKV